ncbi:MAG TPA: zinc-finger-containing protein [Sedimentisphaerales bacterium]|nr:zinc-finger-containing protein [Sedimentisphaerales bacterium]
MSETKAAVQPATEGSICPFCDGQMRLVNSAEIYGRSFGYLYVCSNYPNCDTYVGCHRGSTRALGTPADRALRQARKAAHEIFDRLWRGGQWARNAAYGRLCEVLQVPQERAHIAMLTLAECRQLCRAVKRGDFKRKHVVRGRRKTGKHR